MGRRRYQLGAIALGVVGLLALSTPTQAYNFTSDSSWTPKQAGMAAQLAAFQTIDGKPYQPQSDDKLVVVHIWASWCGPCIKEMPKFDAYSEGLVKRGVKVVSVSVDKDGAKAVVPFVAKYHAWGHSQVLLDPAYVTGNHWGLRTLPTTILVKDGREVARLIGEGEWDGDEGKELDAILADIK